ncbi:MAG: ABC transporter substrate-binding protein [Xanthobacteraceae bacterium]
MKRREFILLLGGASASWPLAVYAQPRLPRVGVLLPGSAASSKDLEIAGQLTRIGYIEGRKVVYEIRVADGDATRLPPLARELVATKPDVIVGSGSPAAIALFKATHEIPIVMTVVGDPIALGLSSSISRPDRNVTGFTISSLSLAAKRLEILHDIVPSLSKVAYLWVPENPLSASFQARVQQAAEVLGITLVLLPLTSETDIAAAFARAEKEQVTAVLVEADPLTLRFNVSIVDQCLVNNLPCMHSWPIEVRNGGLISYGPAVIENNQRAAIYVDRLLKGAKIADLPFEEPTEIKLVVNLRTARSLGIVFPPAVLARADEVIE